MMSRMCELSSTCYSAHKGGDRSTTSRRLVHRHAASPDLGHGPFQVKVELHRMPPVAEQFRRGRRAVVARKAIGRDMFDMMHGPIQVHRSHEIPVVSRG